MARLQRFLAIPMAATAVGVPVAAVAQGGADGFVVGLAAIASLWRSAVGAGLLQRKGKRTGYGAALVAIAAAVSSRSGALPDRRRRRRHAHRGRRDLERSAGAAALAQGHPVFVYFTADWCLTCKANEAAAIDREEVRDAFRRPACKVLAGDWTNGDPAITRFLESRGRAGVPLYLWYAPGKAARGAAADPDAGDAHFPRSAGQR